MKTNFEPIRKTRRNFHDDAPMQRNKRNKTQRGNKKRYADDWA